VTATPLAVQTENACRHYTMGHSLIRAVDGISLEIRSGEYVALLGAVHLFLYFATDMPLFIWKGLPAVKPAELSPVHQYACAPLAFSPLLLLLLIYLIIQRESSVTTTRMVFTVIALAVAMVVPLWLWIVALVLMKVSTSAPLRRVLLLAIYLPVHWFVMLALSTLLWLFFLTIENIVNHAFHLNSVLFR